jgi:cell division protein ZipA
MNELRWILTGFGIVLLACIYLWGRRGGRIVASEDAVVRVRPEPTLHSNTPASSGRAFEPAWEPPHESHDAPDDNEAIITAVRPASQSTDSPSRSAALDSDRPNSPSPQDVWRGRVEPTFAEQTAELPARLEPEAPAPTLSSSDAPQPRRIERRKILSLRLAASPQRLEGARLLHALEAESLQHGKYDVFHRVHDDGASIVFSVASMVEPGTFDVAKMPEMHFPGVTLFTQLPGPTPGMHALNELIACARKLQQALGGMLQDDRGVPLTVHRIERLRQEVRDFERPPGAGGARAGVSHSPSS